MSFKDKRSQRKTSVGVALCRRAPVTRVPQILLIKSRTTYNFTSFVFGKYKLWDTDQLQYRFNNMTIHEKLLVWSCDFGKMWYHIWLKIPTDVPNESFWTFYVNCRTKFERLISKDSGRLLRILLSKSTSVELGWKIPGGRQEIGETELDCALREVMEETGIPAHDYQIMYNIKPLCTSHEDENITYISKYYVGWTDKIFDPTMNFNNLSQISEISDLRWTSLKDANQLVAQTKNLKSQVRLALKLFKRRLDHE